MSASRYATILLEQGLRVAAWTIMQDDRDRLYRVITGLARNATIYPHDLGLS